VTCEGDRLDERGMLVDFGDIKDVVKTYIDENWGHRMLLRRDDPLVEEFAKRGEPYFLFDENPTAETFAKHLFDVIKKRGLPVVEVRFFETPTSCADYRE
jgi:6-pyruvoyltetrahydropterin/6-carboxytetrahydropterin synthase